MNSATLRENSILCEYGVIGSLLIEPGAFPAASCLKDSDFITPALAAVFRVIRRRFDAGEPIDAITVRDEAGRECPGVTDALLVQTMDIVSTTAMLDAYIDGLKAASLGRQLRTLGENLRDAELAPTDALMQAQKTLAELSAGNDTGDAVAICDALTCLRSRVDEHLNGVKPPVVKTGLADFDKMLGGGLIRGGMHVIGARPAVGKSAVALQIALNAAQAGARVVYVSLEMSPEDCTARLTANMAGLPSQSLAFGKTLTEVEYGKFAESAAELSQLPLVFNRRAGISVGQLTALAYREKPDLLILDHLGLLDPESSRLSLYEATTRNSRAIKKLAMRLQIPILCLCQLNRSGATERGGEFRATMANLRESGAIEQDADTVTLLHRPPVAAANAWDPEPLQLYLDKNRRGPKGIVTMTFYPATGRITR